MAIVVSVNFLMSLFVLPRLDFSFLGEERWGATSLSAVMGVWSVAVALAAAILALILGYGHRMEFVWIGNAALWVVVITALVSAADYFRRFKLILNPRVADIAVARVGPATLAIGASFVCSMAAMVSWGSVPESSTWTGIRIWIMVLRGDR